METDFVDGVMASSFVKPIDCGAEQQWSCRCRMPDSNETSRDGRSEEKYRAKGGDGFDWQLQDEQISRVTTQKKEGTICPSIMKQRECHDCESLDVSIPSS